ncbi:MAG TPA: PBP1A family penicillin-binding protein [Desulfomonilia bacterium]
MLISLLVLFAMAIAVSSFSIYKAYNRIKHLGKGPEWHIPSRIYSSETVLKPGTNIDLIGIDARLKRLRYHQTKRLSSPGDFRKTDQAYFIYLNEFDYPEEKTKPRKIKLSLEGRTIKQITDPDSGSELKEAALEPEDFAAIYDQSFEDRTLVTLQDCPKVLTDAIIATEDKHFYENWGIDPLRIFKAGIVNIREGRISQGGSTITQQLVKNIFLTSDRTFSRKIKELWLSIVLNVLYSKDQILEMYINEVYLGQRGNASICGFGRASRVYFDKDVKDLNLQQAAFLAGIICSPNLYSPWKHPEDAKERRNTVLALMRDQNKITEKEYQKAIKTPLGVAPFSPKTRYAPYFVDYILNQMEDDIPAGDLSKGGYSIYTTLDMTVQLALENKLEKGLRNLGNQRLQGAVVAVNPNTGEILGMSGGRSYSYSQFNRAVQMRRQIGSLIKPFIYYEALKKGYTLNRMLDDSPYTMPQGDGTEWTPSNFDNVSHGSITMAEALIQSYNIATVRLGMDVGVADVASLIRDLFPGQKVKENPSLLLGAMESSPLDMAIMFSAFANGGYRVKASAIKAVKVKNDVVYRGSSYAPDKRLDDTAVFLIDFCLMDVIRFGTGKTASGYGMPDGVCGKTGTTNDLRDSWFACFTKDISLVSWVGMDNNSPAGFTGATGAMPIAAMIMASLGHVRQIPQPEGIVLKDIDPASGKLAMETAPKILLPFVEGTEPTEYSDGVPVPVEIPADDSKENKSPAPAEKEKAPEGAKVVF